MTHTIRPLETHDLLNVAFLVAEAFKGRDGTVPERYEPTAIIPKLAWSLDAAGDTGVPRYLVATIGGGAVAIGGYARSRAAGSTWELLLGATRPDLQGRGIGHALMLARWEAIRAETPEGGLVTVSTKNLGRFLRYGFHPGPRNPATGSWLMWAEVPEWDAVTAAEGRGVA